MYVMLIFALALLSPLPFVSPFASVMQDATAQSQFSSFDVDPTSSTVQPLAGPFALLPEVFVTEPAGHLNYIPDLNTMSISEYENTVYALASSSDTYSHINITNPYDIRPFNAESIEKFYDNYNLALRSSNVLHYEGLPYIILTFTDNTGGSPVDPGVGKFHVLNYTFGFEINKYNTTSEANAGTEYTHMDYPGHVDLVTLGEYTYALVASYGSGVQIINVTDPYSLSAVLGISDDTGNFTTLNGAIGITITTIGSSTYALVAAQVDDGVQIIDITDINNPIAASAAIDGQDNFEALNGARDIVITTIGSSTYALVTALHDDGVQIIDITDPYNPTHASAVFDGMDGYDELDGADDIAITTFNNVIFAVVASDDDNGIQFINITDPYNPLPISSIAHEDAGYSLGGPEDTAIRIVDGIPYVFVLTPGALSNTTAMQVIKMDFAAPITLESDNANPKYAKAGDTITLSISTNDDIASHSGDLIFVSTPNVILDGSDYSATLVVSEKSRETYAEFETTITSSTGETLFLDNSSVSMENNVYVDTDAPRITLVGSADHKVPFGASTIYIPGAVATDGDPKYSGKITTMTNATLDTSVLGSAVLYTYTARDSAGNTNSTTRTVTVSDDPPQPEVSSLKIESGNATYVRPGKVVTLTLDLDGFNPTSATGVLFDTVVTPTINGNTVTVSATIPEQQEDGDVVFFITLKNLTSTIHVSNYDITDDSYVFVDTTAPVLTLLGQDGAIVPTGSDFEYLGASVSDASLDSDIIVDTRNQLSTSNPGASTLIYTKSDQAGNSAQISRTVRIQDISAPETVKAFRAHSVTHNAEIGSGYGIVDVFERHDRTYAMFAELGGNNGAIVDITGANITFANLDLNIDGILDIATINIGESSFALIISLSDGGSVHILNMDDPYNPLPASFIVDSSEYPVLQTPNSITATTIGSSTYALVTSIAEDGVQIINITDPYNPTAAWHITDEDGAFTTLNHPTSIITTTLGSSTYALVTARDDHGVQIIDISDPYEPIARSAAINNSDGFTALSNVQDVAITTIGSKTYALAISNVGDLKSGVQIIDITAPANPTAVSVAIHSVEYPYLIHPESIDTITVDSRTYALVTFTGAQISSGVEIIDITTPSSPFLALTILDNDKGYENVRNGLDIEAVTLGSSTFALVASDAPSAASLIPDTSFEIISLDLSDAYIFSKNSATKYAKAGDTLISRFAIDDTVVFTGGSILGYPADAGIAAGDYRAKLIVPDVPIEGYATFIAEVANAAKYTLFVTEDDIPSNENVFVDTIRPNIELVGPENYIIPYRASYLHVPGAVATDGDLDYSGLVVTRTNDTLDSDVLDSVVLYTYTATDPAGNTNSTTRTVTVSDISQPEVSSFGISSSNGTKYAGVGHTVTLTLNLDGFNPTSAQGVLFGEDATISMNGNRITASAVVSQDSPNDKVVFYLVVENSTSSIYVSDYDITDGSYVLVDTIGPKLSLLGGATVTVAQGYNFNDVGAIATDLSFDSDVIVYSTDSVNTLNTGTNTISYTAPTDALGNIGDTITRTVYVVNEPVLQLKTAFDDTPAGVLKSGIDITGPTHTTTFKIGAATYAGISSTDGLAIVDITDIANPSQVSLFNPPASANISSDVTFTAFTTVNGFSYSAGNETIYVPDTRFAVSLHDDDIVFVNMSNVNSPSYHSNITDGVGVYSELDGSTQIIIGPDDQFSHTPLAMVAASDDDGIEFFSLNYITDPSSLRPFHLSSFTDGNSSLGGDIFSLGGASSVATTNIGGKMYVLVAAYDDDSVQILDINPPVGSPQAPHIASTITDGVDGFDRLDGPNFVTTVTIDSSHYALVTSSSNIGNVQIIDITDPYNPIAASSFAHNVPPFDSTILGSPSSIVAIHMGSSTYALISASQGVQVVDITDPYNPIKASSIIDGNGGYTALLNTANIHTTTIDSSIYGLVTSESDSAVQLVRFDPPPIVESSNPNPGYATTGDRLSFVFSVNDPIESSMIQFITPDQTPTVSTTGVVYDTRLTVSSDPVEGYAKFVATLENNGGVNLFVTEDDFSESIFVDTIGPRIELVGSSFHGVLEGSGNPIIPGAIVTDGDPGYTPTYTVSIDGNLDPNVLGSSATYTYTATSDTVGNPGDSINRTVEVITYNPIPLTSLAVSSDNTINNNYARAGDTITITLEIDSIDITSIFGLIAGSEEFNTSINGNDATLTKILKQSDENGELEFELQARNSSGYTAIITNEHLTGTPIIIDTIPPTLVLNGENNTSFPSGTPYVDTHATAYDLSYGFQTISFSAGSIHTTTAGNFFLRYTAPNDPAGNQGPTITRIVYIVNSPAFSLLDGLATSPAGTLGVATTPEKPLYVNTFKIGTSTYAGVGGAQGLFIVDITDIESPEFLSRTNSTGVNDNDVSITTFVEIDGYTYALSAASDFHIHTGGLEYYSHVMITNVSIPDSPDVLVTLSNGSDGYTKMRHPTSIATTTVGSSTYALVTSASSASSATLAGQSGKSEVLTSDDGIQIIDITNPSSPTPVLAISDDQDGYTELNGAAFITTTTIGSSTYALVAARDDSGVQIIDITDPTDPIAVSAATDNQNNFTRLAGAYSIATTTIDSSHYAIVVAPAGVDRGVQIIDITNPNTPVAVSTFTSDNLIDAKFVTTATLGSSTYAFVTSTYSDGVQILDITTPSTPTPVSHISDGAGGYTALGGAYSIATTTIDSLTYALVAARDDNDVQIMSLNPSMSFDNTNPNPEYAKAGDTLTFGFTTNNAIASDTPQFIIPPKAPSVTLDDASYDAVLTIPSDPVEDYAKFTITLTDNQGVGLFVTEDIFPASIFVDTIGPRIDLIGNAFHSVLADTTNPIIPGAIVTDGDPEYTPSYTVTTTGNLDTSNVGSTVTYTYTASSDIVGNPGASVNRTVTVIDYDPISVTNLAVSSNNAVNDSYAKAGDTITISFTADSSDITSVSGILLGNNEFDASINGNQIVVSKTITQDDVNGDLEFEIRAKNSTTGYAVARHDDLSSTPIIIDTVSPTITLNGENNTAFAKNHPYTDAGATAYDLSYGSQIVSPSGTVTIGTIGDYPLTYTAPNDLAGNPGQTITRLVLIRDLPPLSIVDDIVASPAGTLGVATTPEKPIHVSTFKIGTSTYAGVGGAQGLFIVDITDIESPEFLSRTNSSGVNDNDVPFTTFVEIDGSTYALSVASDFHIHTGGLEYYSHVMITDVSIPDSPVEIITISNGTGGYTKMRHPTSIATTTVGSSTYALITSGSSASSADLAGQSGKSKVLTSDDGIQIIDITNPSSPTPVLAITDGADGYAELGGAASITTTTIDSSTYALVASYDDSGVQIIDITDPTDPTAVSAVDGGSGYALGSASYITTTAIGSSTYALVAARSSNAIQIIDITNPSNPVAASAPANGGVYSKLTDASSIAVVTGQSTYAFVTSPHNEQNAIQTVKSGIQVIDITTPYSPTPVSPILDGTGGYTTLKGATSITTTTIDSSTYALVAAENNNNVQIIRLQTPLTLDSTNPNSGYATTGDTLTVGFTIDDTIASHSAQFLIPAQTPSSEITSDESYLAMLTVPSTPVEDNATFSITALNSRGAGVIVSDSDYPKNVFIDTIGPRIALVDVANYEVYRGTLNLSIPGAIATDGDPGYSPNYTVSIDGSLDTNTVGSSVIYTYTADADTVGNPGDSVTRTVTIIDYNPFNVTSLTASSDNSVNNSYARAGDKIEITLKTIGVVEDVQGDILGDDNITSSSYSSGTTFISKIITQSDTNGNLTFDIFVTNSSGYAARLTQDNITGVPIIIDTLPPALTLNGNNDTISALGRPYTDLNATAYDISYGSKTIAPTGNVITSSEGNYTLTYTAPDDLAGNAGPTITRNVRILDLPPLEILEGFNVFPAGTYDITSPDHVATFQIGTATYAGISSDAGLTIVNITDLGSPTYVSRYSGNPTGSNVFSPSFTAFVSIDGSTYALSEYGSRVAIFKANNLVSFNHIATASDGENGFTQLKGVFSIATITIDSSTYALVAAINDNGVQIINITTPSNPIAASAVTDGENYPELRGPVSITTATIGSSTYALVASNADHGVQIIDVTDPYQPSPTSILQDNSNSLELMHPRSITTATIGSSTYALVTSQIDDTVSIVNITTPSTPTKASAVSDGSKYKNLNEPYSITTTIIGSSTYALVAAKGDDGVQVIDITNPYAPDDASSPTNGSNGFTKLEDPVSITTISGLPEYALVTAKDGNGIQIMRINTGTIFESNNQNPAYAKAGDTLRVAFAVDDVFTSDATTFTTPNQIPSVIAVGQTYDAMLTIPSDPIEGYADFTIALGHDQKSTLTVTEDTFNQSVFVDTIRPRIELVGSANYTVFIESNDPFIPGATATDGDPGYSQNYTVTTNGTLDTSKLSTVVVYTYTADDDAAGNPGMSINRTVSVIDFDQITIKSLTLTDNNHGSSDYVKAGDTVTLTLITDGSDVGNATGHIFGDTSLSSSISGNRITFTKTVYENDTNGLATFEIFVRNSTGYAGIVTRADLTSGDVSVDTIPPTITLNGENNTIVVLGRAYTEENATAFDLSYGSPNVLPTGNVNVNVENNYTLTYTAPDDPAGNDGSSITRNVRVIDFPPLSLVDNSTVSPTFSSNNLNTAYAKAGNRLTLEFTVNDTIVSHTTQFTNPDRTPSVTINDTTYTATLTVPSTLIESYADFEITVENNQTVRLSVTEDDFPSNVFIDTIPPTIELDGDADHIIYVDTQNYAIPNATAYDNSPGYSASDYSTSIVGVIDTSIAGSTATYTYTAYDDAAGNPGPSITRTVTVIDYSPLNVTSLTVSSNNSANSSSYAREGDKITITLKTDGDATNAINSITGAEIFEDTIFSNSGGNTVFLEKIITQSDTNGNLTFDILVATSTGYAVRVTQNNLTTPNIIIDTVHPLLYLYGANNTISAIGSSYVDAGAISYDLSYGIKDVTGTGTVTTSTAGTYYIEYDAPDFAGNPANIIRTVHVQELPPLSLTNVSSTLLITPESPIADPVQYPHLTDPFHIETVQIDGSTYALVASNKDHGFTILNMDNPESPSIAFNTTSTHANYSAIQSILGASPIQIQGNTYVVTISASSKILIADITNPASPTVVSERSNGTDYPYLNSMTAISTFNIGDAAYAMIISQTKSWATILNITEPANPTHLTVLENDAIYDLNSPRHIAIIDADGSTFAAITSRTTGTVTILNMDNPDIPVQIHAIKDGIDLALSSATGIELVEINTRTYALVVSNSDNAMQIIDITHPQLPFPVSTVQKSGTEYTGLTGPHYITALQVEGATYAFVTSPSTNSIQVIDITNPSQPNPVTVLQNGTEYTHLVTPLYIESIQTDDAAYALVGSRGSSGIQIIKLGYDNTTQTPFSITSNNANSSYAKAGDTVSIQITVNDTIDSSKSTAQILNLNTNVEASGPNTINASVTIPADSIEMNASITASIANYLGATLNLTESNLTGANVFVDTILPTIELIGSADYTVFVNTDYNDPNATASDGSPGYSANDYSTSKTGTLDTSIVGSTATYTYTAYDDAAGNPGASINRTVTVVNYDPLNVTSLTVSGNNSANSSSYARAGDKITIVLKTDGDATNAINSITGAESFKDTIFSNAGGNTVFLEKTITQSDTNGNLTFDILVATSTGYAVRVTQNNLTTPNIIIDTVHPLLYLYGINNTVSGLGSPYVDAGAISYDLSYGIKDVTGTGTVTTSNVGTYYITYDVPDFAGNPANIIRTVHVQELPPLSLTNVSSTLLITPESPIADPVQYPHLTDPFHIETVQIDGSTYALVASNHDGGFTILNMDNPESPSLVFNATSTHANYSAIHSILGASPIQIQGNTYVVTISASSKILIADITNPASPTVVSERSNGTDYPYLNSMTAISTFNIGDAAYAMIISQTKSWATILNITEPANPTHLTVLENGAIYDLNSPRHIAIIDADGSTFAAITSRTTGTVTILNMDNPDMPVQIHAIKDGIDLALSSATGIELVEINTRTYALVVSNSDNAMQIIDITHPQLPFPVSTVQKSGTEYSGLTGPHYVTALQVEGATYAFVTSPTTKSVQVIDITNPSQPNPVTVLQNGTKYTHLVTPLYIESIQTDDAAYALVGSRGSNGIQIIKLGYDNTTQIPFSITSNNANSSYAKAGDTVFIQITVNDTIDQSKSTVQILNLNTNVEASGLNTINASVTIPADSIEMNASITASITNYLGATLDLTESDITGANVFVDTIPPTIALIGAADYTVLVNTTFNDPNATASDGSPGYSVSDYSKSKTGILNTSMINSTATYTYTAYDDAAGNPGASITRTVTVVDYIHLAVTSLTVSSNNPENTSYAKAGDEITITLVTDGSDIESATGSILGDNILTQNSPTGTITFSKTITQSDTNGNLTFGISVANSTGYAASVSQNDLTSSNIIIDTVPPLLYLYGANNTVSYVGSSYVDAGAISYDLSHGILDVTGTSTVNTGTAGTYDVTYDAPDSAGNPANIIRIVHVQEIPQLSLSSESSDLLITPESPIADPVQYPHLTDPFHIETVQIDGSTYALVASNHDGGFTILNMDNPESPSLVFNTTSTHANYSAIQSILGASPIQIQGNTYVVTISPSKILIADITNPASPTVVSERSNGTDYPYLNSMTAISTFNIGDAAYAMIISQTKSWATILNITEPANPTHLTVLENGANYDLNSPRHIAIIDADGSTFAVITSRNTGTVTILNMDNPDMPVQIHAIKDGIDLALSSATGIELVEINTRTYALVVSNSDNAMQIIDITHPQLPFPVSTVQKSGTEYTGLSGPHYITALQVEGATYAFVTSPSTNSIQVIDITNPFQPNPVTVLQNGTEYTHLVTPLYIESIQTDDAAYALVGSRGSNGIQIIKLGYDNTIQIPFSITSNNANSSYAKAGDTVSIQITVNDTIDQSRSTVQILNLNANVNKSSLNTIETSVTIPADSIEMNASITASITNYLGATLDLTESNLTGANVFVDTIPPTIELIGDADYTVLVNTTFNDPNATASDGSPGYSASDYSRSETGILNTSKIGSTVTYTYTAYDDAAGNLGASTTRTVTIVDYDPLDVTSLTVSSNNPVNNSYAKAGDEITITLVTDGSDIESATGSILGDNILAQNSPTGTITFSKTITQSDTNGNLTFDILVTNSTGYAASVSQNDLTSSNIIIDTISPSITLHGTNTTAIEFGSTYTDLGATANDASYGAMIIYINDVVDTFMIDAYTLVYTAPDDPAGNPGPSITRIVTVSDSTPSMLKSLTLSTSNNNPAYAKAGDIITVTLIANQTISSADTSIQNQTVSNTIDNDTLSATYTIQNNQQGNPTFEITAHFDSSLPLIVNESNLSSSIFIDTEKPKITLLGHSSITVPINQNYTDAMANATDNDPAYNGIVSLNASGVDTATADTYTIVYSANADAAGNIPDNVTRIVTVSGLFVGISSNNEYYDNLAKEGDLVTVKIISAHYINSSVTSATILGKSTSATNVIGDTVYANATVQSSDTNGNITFSITVDPISDSPITFTHDDLNSANVIVDTIAPSVLSSTTLTPNLVTITFSEPIKNVTLVDFRLTMTPEPSLVTITNGSSIPDSVLEFTIPQRSSLSSSATVSIMIDALTNSPTYTDFAGNALPAVSLITDDGISPSMQSAIVVSPTLIKVFFDEDIKFADGSTIVLPPPSVDGVPTGIADTISANTLSLPSSSDLFSANTILKVTIGGTSITDLSGNVFNVGTIFTSDATSLTPYTITKTKIHIPYTMILDPSTISASDYRVTFNSNPSTVSAAQLSNDTTIVVLTMQIPFETDDTPFVEQIDTINDISGNAIVMQSGTAEDRAPPTLVSVASTSTSSITMTFSEPVSAQSANTENYNLLGTTIRSIGSGTEDRTVIISASTFIDATLQIPITATIEDTSGNVLQDGATQPVVKNR